MGWYQGGQWGGSKTQGWFKGVVVENYPVIASKWNINDKSSSVDVIDAGATALSNSADTPGGVRGITGRPSTGDFTYATTLALENTTIGIALLSWPLGSGSFGSFYGYNPGNGQVYANSGTAVGSAGAGSDGDTVRCQLKNGSLLIYRNSSLIYTISGLMNGTYYPALRLLSGGDPFGRFTQVIPTVPANSNAWG